MLLLLIASFLLCMFITGGLVKSSFYTSVASAVVLTVLLFHCVSFE